MCDFTKIILPVNDFSNNRIDPGDIHLPAFHKTILKC